MPVALSASLAGILLFVAVWGSREMSRPRGSDRPGRSGHRLSELGLLQDLRTVERLDLLEDLEVIRNLDGLASDRQS